MIERAFHSYRFINTVDRVVPAVREVPGTVNSERTDISAYPLATPFALVLTDPSALCQIVSVVRMISARWVVVRSVLSCGYRLLDRFKGEKVCMFCFP